MSKRIDIDRRTARRFFLTHQGLLPPRSRQGRAGVLSYFDQVGCVQFDPLDVVGRNADLVLQSRIHQYNESLLFDLLYKDRVLIDGWDKLMSIHKTVDWPFFKRRRDHFRRADAAFVGDLEPILPYIRAEVEHHGPLSSSDIEHDEKVDWHWGPTRLAKAALDLLWHRGELVIERKERVRRIYDLASRLLPAEILASDDPLPDDETYTDWYVKRRIGSVGMLPKLAGGEWLGVWETKTPARRASIDRLVDTGAVTEVVIDAIPHSYYMRSADMGSMDAAASVDAGYSEASVIAPLDNLMWGRKNILQKVFEFDYTWEVYKPSKERQYGYYVIPVLYGDRFIARFEPARRGEKSLGIVNWWWEEGVKPDTDMKEALVECFANFLGFVGANKLERRDAASGDRSLAWITKVRRAY